MVEALVVVVVVVVVVGGVFLDGVVLIQWKSFGNFGEQVVVDSFGGGGAQVHHHLCLILAH